MFAKHPLSLSVQAILCSSLYINTAFAAEETNPAQPEQQALPVISLVANKTTPAADTTKSYVAKTSSSSTKLDLAPREVPQSVSVITKSRMTDQGLVNVENVLANTPGISVKKYDSSRTSFYARGLPIENFQIDGVPTPISYNVSTGLDVTDMAIFDRVEVIHGAGGLNTGSGNPSAVVNFIRKRPSKKLQANALLSYGTWDSKRVELDAGGPLISNGKIRARVGAAYEDKDTFYDYQHNEKNVFYGVLEADVTDKTLFTIGADYTKSKPNAPTWGGLPLYYADGSRTNFSRSKNLAPRGSSFDKENLNVFFAVDQEINDNWKLQTSFSYQSMDQFSTLINANGFPDKTTGLGMTLWAGQYEYKNTITNFDINLKGKFELFNQQHDVIAGWTKNRYVMDDLARDIPGTVFGMWAWGASQHINANTWDGNIAIPDTARTGQITRTKVIEDAAYGAVRLGILDNLKVIAGGRLNNLQQDDVKDKKNKNVFTPYVGAVYDINDYLSAYASYTEVFKPNTARDKNYNLLKPMTGDNTELGLKGEFLDKALSTSIAVFKGSQQNRAVTDNTLTAAELAEYQKLHPGETPSRASGKIDIEGVELEINGKITPQWQISGGYTYAKALEKDLDAPADSTIPENILRVFTTYKLFGALEKLTIGGGVDWQSQFYSATAKPNGSTSRVTQPEYTLVNLMARYDINDNLSATLNANNIFDKKYYNNLGFYNTYLYGEPRNVVLSLRAKF